MSLMTWHEGLSVNVVEIDNQHKQLITILNELADAMKLGKGKDVLNRILQGLINYSETHFRTEEKYFDQFGYQGADSHIKEHISFTQKVADFKDMFEKRNFGLSVEVLNFLCDWLKNHIQGSDGKYAQFFNDNGLC